MPDEKKPVTLSDVVKPVEPAAAAAAGSAATDTTPEVPAKYAGKSLEDIIKMHGEAERRLGQQGAELGEVRRLADSLIQADVDKRTITDDASTKKVELNLDDPDEATAAIEKLITLRVEEQLRGVQSDVAAVKGGTLVTRLDRDHAGWMDTVKTDDYADWVHASPIRKRLGAEADAGSYEAAHELLELYEAVKGKPAAGDEGDTAPDPEAARAEALKQATLETGRTPVKSGGGAEYRRADIMKLRMEDPDRYDSMRAEIRQAYAEGRVR